MEISFRWCAKMLGGSCLLGRPVPLDFTPLPLSLKSSHGKPQASG